MRIKILLLFLQCTVPFWGQVISQKEALSIGRQFLTEKKEKTDLLTYSKNDFDRYELAYTAEKNGEACYYVFNNLKGGYVIVSANDRAKALILGYSTEGHFDYEKLSSSSKHWMDCYTEQITKITNIPNQRKKIVRKTSYESVPPLLGNISWGQDEPYNLLCPEIDGQKCVTGCGATAMAQIMYYHQWPQKGQGKISYMSDTKFIESDLSESTYEWDKMLPIYDSNSPDDSKMAVALLMRDCGYSLEMQYGIYNSACFAHEAYHWIKNFDYDKGIRILPREAFDDEDWEDILWSELDQGRPVIYEGGGDNGSHVFVCDGCDQNGYFHFNFGWDGRENGYFLTSANGYPMGQYMVCGLDKNHGGQHVLDFLSSSSFIYSEKEDLFRLGSACVYDVMEGGDSFNQRAILALAVENTITGEINYYEGAYFPLFRSPGLSVLDIRNNINRIKDGEYKIHPVFKIDDKSSDWIPCTFKKSCDQTYVTLSVKDGKKTFRNELLSQNLPEGMCFIEGLYYMLNKEEMTATVTIMDDKRGSYSGDITIPECIEVDGKKYVVDIIGDGTFTGEGCIYGTITLPRSIKRIEKEAFKGIYVDEIIIPEDSELEIIEESAFDCMCGGFQKTEDFNFVLPKKLRIIGDCAFRSMGGVKSISIPESVEEIGNCAFMWTDRVNDFFVYWEEPLNIDPSVFFDSDLSKINLNVPEGRKVIYQEVYPWSDFSIHDGNNWTEEKVIVDNIHFLLRTPDMTAKILSVNQSKSVLFPGSISYNQQKYIVTEIEKQAARGDKVKISEVYIPKNIKIIGESAFENQENLSKVEFEDNSELRGFSYYSFFKCKSLNNIDLPKNVEWIYAFAFSECENLAKIDIPASVTEIGQSAFENCESLKDVTVHWLIPVSVNNMAFINNTYSDMRLHVPKGTKEEYQKIAPWSLFGQIIEDVDPVFEIPVESISLSKNILNGEEGENIKLKANVFPTNASYKALRWSSSDDSVAVVDNQGFVYFISTGECLITVSALDGSGVTSECVVTCGSGIDMMAEDECFDLYNINGMLVKRDCDPEYMKSLASGLYILRIGKRMKKVFIR